jgi:glycosyltransferase involved in cell wall biosynthesis
VTKFDLTYATVDSLSEGVGSSQIVPLMERLSSHGVKINLMTFEKTKPSEELVSRMHAANVNWVQIPFGSLGPLGGIFRTLKLSQLMPESSIVHARGDFPAVAARFSNQKKVLWDIRSLWADQRKFMESNLLKRSFLQSYGPFESLACSSSDAISTLTKAVVPVLEERHKNLPKLRTVVPTAVDLERFVFAPIMPKKLRGLYSGTYNNYYDLELSRRFIEEIRKLVNCDVDWARPGESKTTNLNAGENAIFSTTQPKMAEIMSAYSFGISICKADAGPSLKAAMPTKIAEFLAIGRPVLVNSGLGDCDELLTHSKTGVIINKHDNLAAKARELIEMCNDKDTSSRCREIAEKYFDIQKGVQNYLSTYSKM